jgi:chromate reductase
MSIIGGENGFIENDNDYLLMAYTNAEIATDGQCREWWEGFADIAAVPGLSNGIRVIRERDQRAGQQPRWKYLVAFGFSGDADRMKAAVAAHKFEDDSALWFYVAIGEQVEKPYLPGDAEEHIFLALTDAKPGRREEFDEWYTNHHLPEIVSVTPYRTGRRFRAIAAGGAEAQWEYLALYRFVDPVLGMHRILKIEEERYGFAHSDSLKDDYAAWIWSERQPDYSSRKYKIGVIVGSLREDSYCRHLADCITGFFPEDFEPVPIGIAGLDMFNEDLEQDPPASWAPFREKVGAVDAYLFVTPEYNRSFPGVLKNAIDVGSRPWGQSKWLGKPGAVAGASISALGAGPAALQLRQTLGFLDVDLMNDPELYLANAAGVFGKDNTIGDKDIAQYVFTWSSAFVAWVREKAI